MLKDKLKIPPQNIEAEVQVLGSLLIDKNAIYKIADLIKSEDFYTPAHEKIYKAIIELFTKNKPIDIVSLTNYFKEQDRLSDIGGAVYLSEIVEAVTTSSNIEHYGRIVKDKKILRDLIELSSYIGEEAFIK